MNVSTRDLVPFHSFKKPKFDWIEVERDDDSLKNTIPTATTTAPTYQIYTPSINYYVGVYLMVIGKYLVTNMHTEENHPSKWCTGCLTFINM